MEKTIMAIYQHVFPSVARYVSNVAVHSRKLKMCFMKLYWSIMKKCTRGGSTYSKTRKPISLVLCGTCGPSDTWKTSGSRHWIN